MQGSFFSFFDNLKATSFFTKELGIRVMSYNIRLYHRFEPHFLEMKLKELIQLFISVKQWVISISFS